MLPSFFNNLFQMFWWETGGEREGAEGIWVQLFNINIMPL